MTRLILLLLLVAPFAAIAETKKADPFTVRFAIDGDATKITLEFTDNVVHHVKDTDANWEKRLGQLYLMHWPRKRVDEPARIYIGAKVKSWTVDRAVKALKAMGLKQVRIEK